MGKDPVYTGPIPPSPHSLKLVDVPNKKFTMFRDRLRNDLVVRYPESEGGGEHHIQVDEDDHSYQFCFRVSKSNENEGKPRREIFSQALHDISSRLGRLP